MKGKNSLFTACIIYIIVGIVLLFFPGTVSTLFCTSLGVLLLAYGGVKIFSFFAHRGSADSFSFQFDLIQGVFSAITGIFFLVHPHFLLAVIPTILGFYVLIDSLVNLKRGLDMRACGYAGWTTTLVMSAISLICGVLILWNRTAAGDLLWRAIGAVFFYQGISDLLAIHILEKLSSDR